MASTTSSADRRAAARHERCGGVRDRTRRRADAAAAEVGPLPRGKSAITVTELPYGVGAERVIAKVKELVTGKKLQGISDVKDLTDRSSAPSWCSR